MAFDGITTACLRDELDKKLTGGRIYKIAQTDRDELVLTIKPMIERGGGQVRLYLSADPSLPLAYLTKISRPAPLQAPSFCMLLRKHLQNGRIVSVKQPGLERILRFEVEHLNEMGDMCRHTLVIELMGKHSNIIFLDDQEKVVDSIKHISSMVSSVREVLPGRDYFVPETQHKRDPLTETRENFLSEMGAAGMSAAAYLMKSYIGISTLMAEELVYRAQIAHDRSAGSLAPDEAERLWESFSSLMGDVREGKFQPSIYYKKTADGFSKAPKDFSAVKLTMYADMKEVSCTSVSELLEDFYAQKNADTRIRQKSSDLRHIVQTILERDLHKYDLQRKQIKDTEKRDKYRVYGELLNAYSYSVPEGVKSVELNNYYTGEKLRVPLDPTMSATDNAKRYFDRYTKLKRTNEALTKLTVEVKAEIDQLEGIRHALDIASDEGDLAQIRQELEESGFVRKKPERDRKRGRSRTPASRPLHYVSSDGYDIFVGKNNIQNDRITKNASGSDIWFHANDMPGSHVILKAKGQKMDEIPDRAFEEAASLAAYYSSGRDQDKVEVDYLERKNVKKPSGSKPGFVVYYTNYSIIAGTDISGIREAEEGTK